MKCGGRVEADPTLGVFIGQDATRRYPRANGGDLSGAASAFAAAELGAYFAVCAHLEAASVVAFDALGKELAAHGLPDDVIVACARAAREEEEHARVTRALTHQFGGAALPLFVSARRAPRALVDIAIENAVEGCVGEVFGAAEALFRALKAADPEVRVALSSIAADEAGHADLSMQISHLLAARLDRAERLHVREAMENARRRLRDEIARREWDPALVRIARVPRQTEALAIFDGLEAAIWSPMSAAA